MWNFTPCDISNYKEKLLWCYIKPVSLQGLLTLIKSNVSYLVILHIENLWICELMHQLAIGLVCNFREIIKNLKITKFMNSINLLRTSASLLENKWWNTCISDCGVCMILPNPCEYFAVIYCNFSCLIDRILLCEPQWNFRNGRGRKRTAVTFAVTSVQDGSGTGGVSKNKSLNWSCPICELLRQRLSEVHLP